jgi:hypothetical protein
MRRIVYLSPFPKTDISGGIKVMYRHVEMLTSMGFEAAVFSPDGYPVWMPSTAKLCSDANLLNDKNCILVYPEILSGDLGKNARRPIPGVKVLLCQNQYHMTFNETLPKHNLGDLGFAKLITVGSVAKRFLERIFTPAEFDVVPVWVDEAVFYPREKSMRIAVIPRKMPRVYNLIRTIFSLKYPRLKNVPWDVIVAKPEADTAETFGRASVFLSLCNRECVPLTPLEAMASGCIVVGFHGYGGLEYATEANGIWLRPDFLEEAADALARAVLGIEQGEKRFQEMRRSGFDTARRYSQAATASALRHTFMDLRVPTTLHLPPGAGPPL